MSLRFYLLNIRSFFFVAAIFIAIASYGQSNVVPDNVELAALRNIYDSLVGSGWTTKTNWPTAATWPASATSSQFGTWYGVTVSNGDINKISLAANNVTGQLPRSIGSLTKLKYLYLENNSITGSIPDTYGNFTGMLNFHLNNNQLTGSIPSSLGNLSTATHLRLQSNSLTGSIPASIGNLTQLTDFMVNSNQLSGPIPGTLGNLVNVEYFYLYGNQLTGAIPSSLGGLNSVHYFNINTNQLTGGIPSSFSNLDEMILFDVSTNQLSGEFPGVINGWLNMTQLKLNNNQFTGDFPTAISGCQALTLIAGQNNQFTSLPTALLSLPLVVTLSFYGNELTTIPDMSTHSNKTNLTLQVQNNRLDFNMLQLVYQKGIKTVSYDPQKALNDLLYLRVSPGAKLVIQSRSAGTGGTYSWERKLEGSSSWVNVNALNEDASAKTFTKSNFQNTDDGQFRYKMTNSLFPSSFSISSAAIAVRVSEFEAVWNSETGVKDVKGIISKTAAAGWGNAGALSENSLPANTDGWFEFTTNASSNYLLGFSLASNVSTALDGVEYGLEVSTTSQKIYAHESSVTGVDLGSWVSGDYFKIARIGATLKYYKNGSEIRSVTVLPNKEYVLKAAINSGTVPAINNSFWLSTSRGAVPDAWEYMALKDFYDSLGGAGWNNKANWPTSPVGSIATTATIMDSWNGITTAGGDITRIDLFSNRLAGIIPSSISRLKKLNTLRVQNNIITGKIPEALSQLSEMSFLNLAINGISGTIPESLGNLPNLTWLGLYQLPSLTGLLPASLFIHPKLENFYIYNTSVAGSIPAVINLPKIKVMYLYRNKLTGSLPESLVAQTTLTNLAIEGNPLMNGPLPSTIGALVNLTELWFNESGFSGPIPSSIGSLTKLQTLNLYDNQLEGTIPSSLSTLVNLRWVALNKNNLSGTIPDVFGQMTKLDSLWLNHNQLTGTIPASMQNLSSIARLSINSNQLSGEVPQWIGTLTKLKYVNLDSNRFTVIGAINYPALTLVKQFTLNNNLLDFIQLTPLKNLNSKFTLFPQNEIPGDTVKFSCSIEIPSRPKASTTSVAWKKYNGDTWTDITSTGQDSSRLTFRLHSPTLQDEGRYMWSMTDTGFPGKKIESAPILVIENGLRITLSEFMKKNGRYCGFDTLMLATSAQGISYQLKRDNVSLPETLKPGNGSALRWTGLAPAGLYTVEAFNNLCGSANATVFPGSIELDCQFNNVIVDQVVSIAATPAASSNYSLTVAGDILSTGLNVKVPSKWPDYVFTEHYPLLSLNQLENFIGSRGHLPNLSSAEQMQQKGNYSVAEMDAKLLEKVEELTLYLLQLKQETETLKGGFWSSKNKSVNTESEMNYDDFFSEFSHKSTVISTPPYRYANDSIPAYGNVSITGSLFIAPYKSVPSNYKLVVGGNIIASGIDIKPVSAWPDYVFTEKHALLTIQEVDDFIKSNKHLPNVMSASVMSEKQDYSIGEMDAILLEKIEELTLYVIQIKKELNSLKGEYSSGNHRFRHRFFNKGNSRRVSKKQVLQMVHIPQNEMPSSSGDEVYKSDNTSISLQNVTISNSLCIGCSGPVPTRYKLGVGGNILATSIDLRAPSKWPDYVFTSDHDLLTLKQVGKFIKKNGHLPNIASANAMHQAGDYDVAQMDARLLEKIEELTLYVIEQNQQLMNLKGGGH